MSQSNLQNQIKQNQKKQKESNNNNKNPEKYIIFGEKIKYFSFTYAFILFILVKAAYKPKPNLQIVQVIFKLYF